MRKQRFSLNRHLMLCERNYGLLLKMLRQARSHPMRRVLQFSGLPGLSCTVRWQSTSRWGDVLYLSQARQLHENYSRLTLIVGLYHDFFVAEITRFQGKRPPMPGLKEPGNLMPADEKLQQNLFLHHWLRAGLDLTRCSPVEAEQDA